MKTFETIMSDSIKRLAQFQCHNSISKGEVPRYSCYSKPKEIIHCQIHMENVPYIKEDSISQMTLILLNYITVAPLSFMSHEARISSSRQHTDYNILLYTTQLIIMMLAM